MEIDMMASGKMAKSIANVRKRGLSL